MSKTIKYAIIHEVDADLLIDPQALKDEFNGSWQEFLKWFWDYERGELICGMQSELYPPKIKLITETNLVDKEADNE